MLVHLIYLGCCIHTTQATGDRCWVCSHRWTESKAAAAKCDVGQQLLDKDSYTADSSRSRLCNVCECRDLERLEATPSGQRCMQRSELCRSLAGNSCPLITITNPSADPHIQRPAVVFSGTAYASCSWQHCMWFVVCIACLHMQGWCSWAASSTSLCAFGSIVRAEDVLVSPASSHLASSVSS